MRRSIRVVPPKAFQWWASEGEHSYGVRLYEVLGGQELEVDGWSGEVSVASQYQRFAVFLDVFPTELEGGGTVFFTVGIRNFDAGAISVRGFVEDESGAIIKRIDGFEGIVPANGGKNVTFTYIVHGVGNHMFRVFLDNYDGKPNGAGEEHWAEVTVEVKPGNGTELKQVGFECDDPEFNWNRGEYTATLVCRAFVYNPYQNNIEISTVSVERWSVDNPDLKESLEHAWVVKYPDVIKRLGTGVIIFENTAHTGLITLEKDLFGAYFEFRFEKDGRVVGFNPVTWKITIMNPTMGEIIKVLQRKGSVKFSDLVTHLCIIYPETSRKIIKNDLKNAVLWLFTRACLVSPPVI